MACFKCLFRPFAAYFLLAGAGILGVGCSSGDQTGSGGSGGEEHSRHRLSLSEPYISNELVGDYRYGVRVFDYRAAKNRAVVVVIDGTRTEQNPVIHTCFDTLTDSEVVCNEIEVHIFVYSDNTYDVITTMTSDALPVDVTRALRIYKDNTVSEIPSVQGSDGIKPVFVKNVDDGAPGVAFLSQYHPRFLLSSLRKGPHGASDAPTLEEFQQGNDSLSLRLGEEGDFEIHVTLEGWIEQELLLPNYLSVVTYSPQGPLQRVEWYHMGEE